MNVSIGNIMVLKLFFSNHFYELLFSIINTHISSINKQFEGLQWIDADDTGCERCAVDLEGLQWTEADDTGCEQLAVDLLLQQGSQQLRLMTSHLTDSNGSVVENELYWNIFVLTNFS